MRKFSTVMVLSLVLMFGLAMQAWAYNVTYSGGGHYLVTDVNGNSHNVKEDYGQTGYNGMVTVPYDFQSNAVVDYISGQNVFFDKTISFSAQDAGNPTFTTTWDITNNTQFTWSDYHFIIQGNAYGVKIKDAQSADFQDTSFTDTTANYIVDPTNPNKYIEPGETLQLTLKFDLSGLPDATDISVRQIATVPGGFFPIPLPATLPLLGTGLLALGIWRWRRN